MYWYLHAKYGYLYWYLDHWYWYWYWYLLVEYLIQDWQIAPQNSHKIITTAAHSNINKTP